MRHTRVGSTSTRASTAPLTKERDPHLDNVKGILLILVVVGHALGQTLGTYLPGRNAYTWIYLFQMPAFAFVSGLLGQSSVISHDRARGVLTKVLLPYVVLQLGYALYWEVNGHGVPAGLGLLLSPLYQLWFLIALLIWRLTAPLFEMLRWPVVTAVVLSLLAGTTPLVTNTLALNRTLAYLPFYVIGLVHGPRLLKALKGTPVRLSTLAALPLSLVIAEFLTDRYQSAPWLHRFSTLSGGLPEGALVKLVLIAIGTLMTLMVLSWAPRRKTFVTSIGTYSMYPYVLHGLFTIGFGWHGPALTGPGEVGLLVLGAMVLTWLLATPLVRTLTRPLVEPPAGWLVRARPPRHDADTPLADGRGRMTP